MSDLILHITIKRYMLKKHIPFVSKNLIKPPVSKKIKLGVVMLKKNQDVGEHITADSEEVLIILSGKGIAVVEGKEYEIQQGDFIFIPENKKHNIINTEKDDLRYVYVVAPT